MRMRFLYWWKDETAVPDIEEMISLEGPAASHLRQWVLPGGQNCLIHFFKRHFGQFLSVFFCSLPHKIKFREDSLSYHWIPSFWRSKCNQASCTIKTEHWQKIYVRIYAFVGYIKPWWLRSPDLELQVWVGDTGSCKARTSVECPAGQRILLEALAPNGGSGPLASNNPNLNQLDTHLKVEA